MIFGVEMYACGQDAPEAATFPQRMTRGTGPVRILNGRRRGLRALCVMASACALALTAVLSPVAPAAPAEAVDRKVRVSDEEYYSRYNLEALHAQGYTGEGVIIAVIDGHIDTSIPELQGADIVDKSTCDVPVDAENDVHATYIAQLLVAPDFGIAPKATIYNYTTILDPQKSSDDCSLGWTRAGRADTDYLIEQAINDGADIITISSNFDDNSIDLRWAMARAMAAGVIVVAAMGNETTEDPDDALAIWTGICGIGATLHDGSLTEYTNWGNGLLTTALGTVLTRDTSTGRVEEADGTSFATPIIAGFLALGWQHFDEDVSAGQMLQALAATGRSGNEWNKFTGYGPADPIAFLRSDPSQYTDENPCVPQDNRSLPTRDDVIDYMDGVVNPILIRNDDVYVYRGVNEEAALSREHGYPTHIGTSPRYHSQ